jgi:hypothetical protein
MGEEVFNSWGNHHGIQRLHCHWLHADAQNPSAFDDHIERVGSLVGSLNVLLTRLQADQLAGQARAVEQLEPDRTFAQELAAAAQVDYIHWVASFSGEAARFSQYGSNRDHNLETEFRRCRQKACGRKAQIRSASTTRTTDLQAFALDKGGNS